MYGEPIESTFAAAGARICYFEWGRRGDPTVLLLHATGFHARCWDQVVAALPPSLRIVAVDARGHGRSEKTGPIRDWSEPASDIAELVAHLDLKDAIGAGHSMGGHLLVQVAAARPQTFQRLVLVDPVIMSPEIYAQRSLFPPGTVHPVARRRNNWVSWEEMFSAFKDRNPYSLWRTRVLEDYCRYGVLPAAGGGVELACPPEIEASIYMGSIAKDVYELVARIEQQVTVLRAQERAAGPRDRMDFSQSPTWSELASKFKRGRDVYLPYLTHFIPMQEPELVARFIAEADASP